MRSWVVLLIIIGLLLGSCSAIAGDASHWPATAIAIVLIVLAKLANDRLKILAWPMEFLLASGVTMILVNLVRLYMTPLPY